MEDMKKRNIITFRNKKIGINETAKLHLSQVRFPILGFLSWVSRRYPVQDTGTLFSGSSLNQMKILTLPILNRPNRSFAGVNS